VALRCVWLRNESTVGGRQAVERLNRSWVRLVGVFHNRRQAGAGHFGVFPAFISDITKFEPAEEPTIGHANMDIDTDKIDEAVLALLHLTRCDDKFGAAAWKSHDWDALNRLHEKGYIGNPVSKNKSVGLTEEGKIKAEELFRKLFGKSK
jgi:Domain of unknown function (DUF6429)